MLYYILGNSLWGIAGLALMRWKHIKFSRTIPLTILAFFPLMAFHAYMIGRIYVYGPGTTEILLWVFGIHVLYLDDIVFFVCFPFFVAVFVEAFAGAGRW